MARQRIKREAVTLTAPSGSRVTVSAESAEAYRRRGYREPGASSEQAGASGAPKGNASREAWAEYAESLGVEFCTEATRNEIKAAVFAADD